MFAGCCTTEVDGQYVLLTCATTGFEGIFSGQQAGSMTEAAREHEKAHDDMRYRIERAFQYRQARAIYNTTEPGDPARRGIGAYL